MDSDRWRVDPHVKVLDERVVRRAKRRGLDGLVYAPHFTRLPTIEARATAFGDDELTVYPAREIFTGTWRNRRHVLALGLTEPIPDFITLEGALNELDRQGATVLIPHPTFLTVSLSATEIRRFHDRIHALEVYNPKHWPRHNRQARALAKRYDLPTFGSSYAHLRGTIGEVWTTFPRPLPDYEAFAATLRDRSVHRAIERRAGRSHAVRRAAEFAHLGWENSWQKFDRTVRSGLEATHPAQPAYGGRFDDVAVYDKPPSDRRPDGA